MAQVKQHDKRSGITYVYESTSYWDPVRKQPRSHRTLVGRWDPDTGSVVPTDGRNRRAMDRRRKQEEQDASAAHRRGRRPSVVSRRVFSGANLLLDGIAQASGVSQGLEAVFGRDWRKVLTIAQFLVMEPDACLSRLEHWMARHATPFDGPLPSQRVSELFASISEDQVQRFFRQQAGLRLGGEYWAFDSTSISSYSQCLNQVRYGRNKEHDRLPQLNLALLFGHESGLPFAYTRLPGNMPDVKTMNTIATQLGTLVDGKPKLCMDRGYYSQENINLMMNRHIRFVIGAPKTLNMVRQAIDANRDTIRDWGNWQANHHVYATGTRIDWPCQPTPRPHQPDIPTRKRRAWLHVYYNPERVAEDETTLNRKLGQLEAELTTDKRVREHEADYARYFHTTRTPKRGLKITANDQAIREQLTYSGWFALLTNDLKDPGQALDTYRTRDVVEKAFHDIKTRLNGRRTLVSSNQSLDGKLFVQFIALILTSWIKHHMNTSGLAATMTMQQLLDTLDDIETITHQDHTPQLTPILTKQQTLYTAMNIPTPNQTPQPSDE